MNVSFVSTSLFLGKDLRAGYEQLRKDEIAARLPAEGVELMKETRPEQLEFKFSSK